MDTKEETNKYCEETKGIRISVLPRYIREQSKPYDGEFAFGYTVTIENQGSVAAQLLDRHWIVKSGGEDFTEVHGEGVVGEQPILRPGESFQYSSGSVIKDPIGSMKGSYTLVSEKGELFEAEIPEFELFSQENIH